MNPLVLKSAVVVRGKDFWGRDSSIKFSPGEKGKKGWFWRTQKGGEVLLNSQNAMKGTRQIQFVYKKEKLHIFEHLGPLKFLGFLDVVIESDPWPPYFAGRGKEFLDAILPNLKADTSREIVWYTLSREVKWDNWDCGKRANIQIVPRKTKTLKLNVQVVYRGIGQEYLAHTFPDSAALTKVCSVPTQGWPPRLFYLSAIAGKCGWPHHREIVWSQRYSKEPKVLLDKFALHRTFDLLGALSLVCPADGLLSAEVFSSCCGHQGDLALLAKIAKVLRPLN